jgi:hypothetical protein
MEDTERQSETMCFDPAVARLIARDGEVCAEVQVLNGTHEVAYLRIAVHDHFWLKYHSVFCRGQTECLTAIN